MKNINNSYGLSLDGLIDTSYPLIEVAEITLKDVVLTNNRTLLALDEAEAVRDGSGYPWPPVARADTKYGKMPSRLPISWAWKLLVEEGELIDTREKGGEWVTNRGYKIKIEEALAAHIASYIKKHKIKKAVLTIPDSLNEFGQEWLIRALNKKLPGNSRESVSLLRRPVATALSLIENENFIISDFDENTDYILTVNFCADALEINTFKLRFKSDDLGSYYIPVRDPVKERLLLSGCDLVTKWIESKLENKYDFSAWWQAFTVFNESWLGVCEEQIQDKEDLVPWCINDNQWHEWSVNNQSFNNLFELKAERSEFLKELKGKEIDANCTWSDYLYTSIKKMLETKEKERLCGIIIDGSIAPSYTKKAINKAITEISSNRIHRSLLEGNNFICNTINTNCIAKGASLYSNRISLGRDTYLDIVEQIDIWASSNEGMTWVPLLEEKENRCEILGGTKVTKISAQKFKLSGGSKELILFIRRGSDDTRIKKATTIFPFAPPEDVEISVKTTISTASGFALIEFLPKDNSFLAGERVFFDFERMENATEEELSKGGKGYEEEEFEISIGENIQLFKYNQNRIEEWLLMPISSIYYKDSLDQIRRLLIGSPGSRTLNQNGIASNSEVLRNIKEISLKLGEDFQELLKLSNKKNLTTVKRKILLTALWLYSASPEQLYKYLISNLASQSISSAEIRLAGRVLSKREDILLYFKIAEAELNTHNKDQLISAWLYGLYQILILRPNAEMLLTRAQADTFIIVSLNYLHKIVSEGRIKQKFIEVLGFTQALLRYRKISSNFPESAIKNKIINLLEEALRRKKHEPVRDWRRAATLDLIIPNVIKYLNHQGSEGVIKAIETALEGGEESEDI